MNCRRTRDFLGKRGQGMEVRYRNRTDNVEVDVCACVI